MNGRDLAGNLRSPYPALKVLFMSGYSANVIAWRRIGHRGELYPKAVHLSEPVVKSAGGAGRIRLTIDAPAWAAVVFEVFLKRLLKSFFGGLRKTRRSCFPLICDHDLYVVALPAVSRSLQHQSVNAKNSGITEQFRGRYINSIDLDMLLTL